MYSQRQKLLAGLALLIAAFGLLNLFVLHASVGGLSAKQIAMLAFLPALLFSFVILR
jgi:hypothetical protein